MKKSKMMKALLVFGMSAITATSIAGFTACGDGHTHNWSWKDDGNGTTHSRECTAEGHEGATKETENHKDNNKDGKCDACKYVMSTTPGPGGPGTGEEEGPGTSTKAPVTIDVKDIGSATVAGGTALGTNSGIKAWGASATVEANNKKTIFNGEALNLTHRYKLDQTITNSDASKAKGLEVNVDENATVLVYAYSGSGGQSRSLALYTDVEGTKTLVQSSEQNIGDGYNDILGVAAFNVEANTTYYIGAKEAGINIYYIAVVYGQLNETWTDVAAAEPDCEAKGNIAHHVSNYGRYYTTDASTLVSGSSTVIAAKGHTYPTETITITENLPDAENGKTYTVDCTRDGCTYETGALNIELPKLSSPVGYTRTAAGEGQTTYTYTDQTTGVKVSFTTTTVDVKQSNATKAVLYTDANKSIIVKAYDEEWAVDASIVAATGTINSLYQVSGENLTSTYDNGTADTADDLAIGHCMKCDSKLSLTLDVKKACKVTLYYAYKDDTNTQNIKLDGTATSVKLTNSGTNVISSYVLSSNLSVGTHTIIRGSGELEICYILFEVL